MQKKNLFVIIMVMLCLGGCATASRHSNLPTLRIQGSRYVAVTDFCGAQNIRPEYDNLTRRLVLKNDRHEVVMAVGDRIALVDGKLQLLDHPVRIHEAVLMIPDRFRKDILEVLFSKAPINLAQVIPFSRINKVVIDAGHGGKDPGAISKNGLQEKDITIDISRRLGALFEKDGVKVIYVRKDDRYISLDERVDITNRAKADFFISIHVNANPRRSMKGFEIYHMSQRVSDTDRALRSARQLPLNMKDAILEPASFNLKATVWDLMYTYNRQESVEMSASICKNMPAYIDTQIIGVKNANYCVLRGSSIPAVLIEVGFLSNSSEANMLRESSYRQRIAEGILSGIKTYDKNSGYNAQPTEIKITQHKR